MLRAKVVARTLSAITVFFAGLALVKPRSTAQQAEDRGIGKGLGYEDQQAALLWGS